MPRHLVLILAAACLAAGEGPSAHDPRFDQPGLWPEDVKKAAYAQQKWEKARLLVWARSGAGAAKLEDPANWLEDGKPATQAPDAGCDLVFPDAPKAARLDCTLSDLKARHVTVGKGIQFNPRVGELTGNLWVKEGGTFVTRNFRQSGTAHTFLRCDSSGMLCGKAKGLFVNKGDATVELLGFWETHDWFQVDAGMLIVGPGARYGGGNRHQNVVGPKGSMAVLSGATFTTWKGKPWAYDIDLYGTLLIGTPERPLTRDAFFLLNAKPREDGRMGPMDRSLQTRPGSILRVHSTDPAKARLVIRLRSEADDGKGKDLGAEKDDDLPESDPVPAKGAVGKAGWALGKLDFRLLGELHLDGVLFQDVAAGGIQLPDPAVRKDWKLVAFGSGCAGEGEALFAVADKATSANGDVMKNAQFNPDAKKKK